MKEANLLQSSAQKKDRCGRATGHMNIVRGFPGTLDAVNLHVLCISPGIWRDSTSVRPQTSWSWDARSLELQDVLAAYYSSRCKLLTILQHVHSRYPRLRHLWTGLSWTNRKESKVAMWSFWTTGDSEREEYPCALIERHQNLRLPSQSQYNLLPQDFTT